MFKLTVALPDEIAFEGNVEILNITVSGGRVGIMKNHTPFVDMIKACEMTIKDEDGKNHKMAVSGGWLFVWTKEVTVYVNSSEFDYEIDLETAAKQKEEAEKILLNDNELDVIKRAHARAALEKAINRINVGSNKK